MEKLKEDSRYEYTIKFSRNGYAKLTNGDITEADITEQNELTEQMRKEVKRIGVIYVVQKQMKIR